MKIIEELQSKEYYKEILEICRQEYTKTNTHNPKKKCLRRFEKYGITDYNQKNLIYYLAKLQAETEFLFEREVKCIMKVYPYKDESL